MKHCHQVWCHLQTQEHVTRPWTRVVELNRIYCHHKTPGKLGRIKSNRNTNQHPSKPNHFKNLDLTRHWTIWGACVLKILMLCGSGRLDCHRTFSRIGKVTRISGVGGLVEGNNEQIWRVGQAGNAFSKHEGCQISMANKAVTCNMAVLCIFLVKAALSLVESRHYLMQLHIYTEPLVEDRRLCGWRCLNLAFVQPFARN